MLRAILFDFDGTIVLSEPVHFAAYVEAFERRGLTLTEADYYARYVGITDRDCIARMIEDFARPDLRPHATVLLREKSAAMAARIARGVPLCPGVDRFLPAAAERAELAVVSGAIRSEIVAMLAGGGLARFFPIVVGADDVTAGKPDPEGFLRALESLRRGRASDLRPEECLVIEDTPRGIEAGHAAGMRVLALPHTFPAEALRGADRVYASYDAIEWPELEALFDGPDGSLRGSTGTA